MFLRAKAATAFSAS